MTQVKYSIACPKCGSTVTKVVQSRKLSDGSKSRRRRCHKYHLFTAYEISELEYRKLKKLRQIFEQLQQLIDPE